MRRTNVAFAIIVVLSSLVGATAAADFGTELNTLGNIVPVVQEQVTTEVREVQVTDGALHIAVRIENPTGYDISITGAFFRVFNGTDAQLAQGPGTWEDGEPLTVPAKGELEVRYEVALTDDSIERLRAALDAGDARLIGRFGAELNDEEFTLRMDPRPLDERRGA